MIQGGPVALGLLRFGPPLSRVLGSGHSFFWELSD